MTFCWLQAGVRVVEPAGVAARGAEQPEAAAVRVAEPEAVAAPRVEAEEFPPVPAPAA